MLIVVILVQSVAPVDLQVVPIVEEVALTMPTSNVSLPNLSLLRDTSYVVGEITIAILANE